MDAIPVWLVNLNLEVGLGVVKKALLSSSVPGVGFLGWALLIVTDEELKCKHDTVTCTFSFLFKHDEASF